MSQNPSRVLFSPSPPLPLNPMVNYATGGAGDGMQPQPARQGFGGQGVAESPFQMSDFDAGNTGNHPPQQSSGITFNCYAPVHVNVYGGEYLPRATQMSSTPASVNGMVAATGPQAAPASDYGLIPPIEQQTVPASVKAPRKRGPTKKKASGAQVTKTDGTED